MEGGIRHTPVMLEEAVRLLDVKPGHTYIDATAGFGGHAEAILKQLTEAEGSQLILIDRDEEALEYDRVKFEHRSNCRFYHDDFRNIASYRDAVSGKIMGILFDLGVSAHQLERGERGFSFQKAGPLDMRMDRKQEITAADVLNTYSQIDLTRVIREYGEERYAERIARAIVAKRPISDTAELSSLISETVPARGKIHPATRTFQALRIEVNDELASIEEGLRGAIELLAKGGRLVVITFHSLEERVVKGVFNAARRAGDLGVLTARPLAPSVVEVRANPRARSARLRAAEKIEGRP